MMNTEKLKKGIKVLNIQIFLEMLNDFVQVCGLIGEQTVNIVNLSN